MSWEQIIVILLVGLFLLGPERIPTVVQWIGRTLRQLRDMASGAQTQLQNELGPEIAELRKQVAELQSLREVADLRQLRDLHPRRIISSALMGDENAPLPATMAEFLAAPGQSNSASGPADPASEQPHPAPGPPAAPTSPPRQIRFDPEGT